MFIFLYDVLLLFRNYYISQNTNYVYVHNNYDKYKIIMFLKIQICGFIPL